MKIQNKKWLITYVVVALILVTGVSLFLAQGQQDKSEFPELSLAPGSTFKGMFTDPAKYWQYEEGDTCTHDASLTSNTLKQGQHIYYAKEDLTFQDVLDRINCVPFNRIRILYPDPETKTFYSFPESYYQNTTTVSDPSAVTIKAFHGFIIESSKETLIGGILDENDPIASGLINESPTLSYFIEDIESGWVLLPGRDDLVEFSFMLNALSDRIEKVFTQVAGDYAFVEIPKVNNEFDVNFNEGFYFVWMKILEEVVTEEVVVEDLCDEETDVYQCITTGQFPVQFVESGADACASIGKVCAAVQQQYEGGEWQPYNDDICDQGYALSTDTLRWRAVCAEESELDDPEILCDPSDLNYACITETNRTGADACTAINRTCNDDGIEYNSFGTPETWVSQPFTDCSVDYDNLASDSIWRAACNIQIAPLFIEVEIVLPPEVESPCDSVPAGYDCIIDENGLPLFTTGEELCQDLSTDKHCIAFKSYDTNTETWSEDEMDDACSTLGPWILGNVYDPYAVLCTDQLINCGGNDATHSCMTDNSFNQSFRWTGDEACSYIGKTCTSVEEYYVPNQSWVLNISNYGCDSSVDVLWTDKTLRAVCE